MTTAPFHRDEPATRRPVVVGLDGSQAALNAMDWAAQEAAARGCGLELVHAHPNDIDALAILDVSAREYADDIFDAARDRLAPWGAESPNVSTMLGHGAAARVLLRAAEGSPMLVVGRRGRGPLADMVMGSTSLACATHGRTPLAVVPETSYPGRTSKSCVLLGIDGSPRCDAAVEYAFGVAVARRWRIIAVHAVDRPVGYPLGMPLQADVPRLEEIAERAFSASLDTWGNEYPDVDVTRTTEYGHPVLALAEHAAGADVAVIGGRGHGVVTGMLLGSVARAVLRRMPIPVTVVHDTERRR